MSGTASFIRELQKRSGLLHTHRSFRENLIMAVNEYVPHDASGITLAHGAAFDFRAIHYGYPPSYLLEWGNRRSTGNERWKRFFDEGPKRGYVTLRASELQADFYQSDEYHRIYQPSGLLYSIQTMFFYPSGQTMGLYACNRFSPPLKETDFSDKEKAAFDAIAPSVFFAFRRYRWLAEYDFFQLDTLDDTMLGVITADTDGRISFINNTAAEILRRHHGSVPGRLTPHLKQARAQIMTACSGKKEASLFFRNIGVMSPYGTVVPYRLDSSAPENLGTKKGMVFFVDTLRINQDMVAMLSPRERQVTHYLIQGRQDKEIASDMGLSEKTVQTYMRGIFHKFGVTNRTEAAVMAMRMGLG